MKRDIPVIKNNDYKIEITGMGHEGEGVGRIDNFTIFVPGAITGEEVEVKIIKIEKNYAIGKLLKIVTPSTHRVSPVCGMYKKCGGCQVQHMSYEGQLEFKRRRVIDAVLRIGKLENITVHETIGMKNPYRYRNKVQLPVGSEDGRIKIGFYAPRSHDIIDMVSCDIQDEIADKVIKLTREWMEMYNISPYEEKTGTGVIRHIMIRKAFKTGEVMVVIVSNTSRVDYLDEFVKTIVDNVTGIASVVQNVNYVKTNVILGNSNRTLWGKDTITDYIGSFKFNISPLSFFQVNPVQTEILYEKALEYADLKGKETVFDAYCGTGTISLFLAQNAKKVIGVEIVPEAIENARENARNNNINNAEFIVGESEKVIPGMIEEGVRAEVVVVDPPRKGCEKELLLSIGKMSPERIVYVSCDPGTLARDLAILDNLGYSTLEIQPVDMFPQTAHIECVARIERK